MSKSEPLPIQLEETVVVNLDIFFSSTSIVAATTEKNSQIYPLADEDKLSALIDKSGLGTVFATEDAILSRVKQKAGRGELLASRSNMPLKLLSETTDRQRFAFLSSSGTPAICASRHAALSLVGSLANLEAIAQLLSNEFVSRKIYISCAGSPNGSQAIEDTWAAGKLTSLLLESKRFSLNDLSLNSLFALELFRQTPRESLLVEAPVARMAIARGDEIELDYALDPPNSISVPFLDSDGWIKNLHSKD